MDFDRLTTLLDRFADGEVSRDNMLAQIRMHADESVAAERERWTTAAALAFDALCLDAGGDAQIVREQEAIRALRALLA